MDIKEINAILRTKAIKAGLCEDWQKNVWNRDLSIPELLEIYKRGFDFSLKQEWFDYDFIKVAFPTEELHKAHIYLDEEVGIEDAEGGTWIFLGKCRGHIGFRGFSVGTVYLRHESGLGVSAHDMAKVFVSMYEQSGTETMAEPGSVIKVYDRRAK